MVSRVAGTLAEAAEAVPLVQAIIGEATGAFDMTKAKFVDRSCVSPLDF